MSAVPSGRARRYLLDALDGEGSVLAPAVRRGLVANAESTDALREETEHEIGEIRTLVQGVKRSVIAGSTAIVLSVVGSAIAVIFER